jgi:hypothetical protein
VIERKKGTCMFIGAAILGGRNLMMKEAEKILKYKDVTTATQCLWSVKSNVISVIIGAAGTISD